jgi:hypothetical protein
MGMTLSKRAFSYTGPALTREAYVLVIANSILGKPLQDRPLVPKFIEPVSKSLKHFALNL